MHPLHSYLSWPFSYNSVNDIMYRIIIVLWYVLNAAIMHTIRYHNLFHPYTITHVINFKQIDGFFVSQVAMILCTLYIVHKCCRQYI